MQYLSRPHRLEQYSIFNTKCIGVIDPEGPEKHIENEVGATFTDGRHKALNTRFCEYKVLVKVDPSRATKRKMDKLYDVIKREILPGL